MQVDIFPLKTESIPDLDDGKLEAGHPKQKTLLKTVRFPNGFRDFPWEQKPTHLHSKTSGATVRFQALAEVGDVHL